MVSLESLPGGLTTGIGSLPHHNIDSALQYAFKYDIPFLPQIPLRNPWEFSIPQGLEGLPGIRVEKDGSAFLDEGVWVGRASAFEEKLSHAFGNAQLPSAFEAFEPSAATSSSWQPFLWELQERGAPLAKVQIIGPLTAQWSLRSLQGERLDQKDDISRQIFQLVLARAIGMARRIKDVGVRPLLFLDEPALFVLSPENPAHLVGLQELRVLVQALQKEGVAVGLHCCSNTQWGQVLALGIDFLSLDTRLSLQSLLCAKADLSQFLDKGGRLSFGIVPTSESEEFAGVLASDIFRPFAAQLSESLGARAQFLVAQGLWTPACGLALHTPKDAESVYSLLKGVAGEARAYRL